MLEQGTAFERQRLLEVWEKVSFAFQFNSPLEATTQQLRLAVINQLPGDKLRVRLNQQELPIRLETAAETMRRNQPIPGGIWQTTADTLPLKPGENLLQLEVIARDVFPHPLEVGEFEVWVKPKN